MSQQQQISSPGTSTAASHKAPSMSPTLAATTVEAAAGPRLARRLAATVRQLFVFCARERLWTLMMLLFIATWTIELYAVQAQTLVYPNDTSAKFEMWAPKIRLTLDLLLVSAATMALRRRWLVLTVIVSFFAYLILITYFDFFFKPLSLLTVVNNWREGIEVGTVGWEMFPLGAAALLALALAIKLTVLVVSRRATLPRPCAWLAAGVLFSGYLGLYGAANYLDPLSYIQTTRGVGRLGHIRGYLGPWFAEWYYLTNDQLLEEVLAERDKDYDRLTPIEADIPIHDRLVFVQAESLDTNNLEFKVNGAEVTPFLNKLRQRSMFYRVRAIHRNGSSDADFVAMTGFPGSKRANTYTIPGYPYENTTPQLLAACGFKTYAFHGNSGEFYNRRHAFERMGFEDIIFEEEMLRDYGVTEDIGGMGVYDAAVLKLSAEKMLKSTTPTCHFIITLTSHTPYNQLPPGEAEIFPNAASAGQRYLNNMRYVDNCLRDYLTSLGKGVTVVIYADHPAEQFECFTSDRGAKQDEQFIPCFIFDTDQDLSKLQKTANQSIATDGTLNLVDVINYVRGQAKRVYGDRSNERSAESAAL